MISLAAVLLHLTLSSCGRELEEQNRQLSQKIDSLRTELQQERQENARLREASGQALEYGYEVQIGAFREFDLQAYQDELHRFTKVESQGMNKYVLGRFARKEDAERFLHDVRRMGIQDAWIAGIAEGQRTTVSEADKAGEDHFGEVWVPVEE